MSTKRRPEFHEKLIEASGFPRDRVHYEPPESLKLKYPCIVYEKARVNTAKADNRMYDKTNGYTVTVMTFDEDSTIYEDLLDYFPMASYDRNFKANQLYHEVITIYY